MARQAVGFTVTGNRDAAAAFGRLSRDVNDMPAAFDQIGARVTSEASHLAPRRSGRLASSVHMSRTRLRLAVVADVPYAGPTEYGWGARRIPAQPFLRPAADTKGEATAEAITADIHRKIRTAGLG